MPEGKRTQKAPCRKKIGYRKPRAGRETNAESPVQKENGYRKPSAKGKRVQKAPCGRETENYK